MVLQLLDVSSLHTNIPQEKGIGVVCRAITKITTSRNYLSRQAIYGRDAMGTKMAVTFSVIFMAHLEKRLFAARLLKPFTWERFIDNIFFLSNIPMKELSIFVTSLTRSVPLHDQIYLWNLTPVPCFSRHRGIQRTSLFNSYKTIRFKRTQTFQYTHISSCHPYTQNFNTKETFIKGEALRLLRTNSLKEKFDKYKREF